MSGMSQDRTTGTMSGDPVSSQEQGHAYDIESIRFRYPSRESSQATRWILDDISFHVQAGEVLGVVGPNGSGKTSLLKVLARLLTPQEGCINLFGREVAAKAQREIACLVGVVPQDSHILFPFTVAEAVLMGRFPHRARDRRIGGFGWESREDLSIAEEVMMMMDVVHLAHRSVTGLSGGERQRTVIARALAQTPQVLLLDEPTAFLDLQHQVEVCSILRRLRDERGLTVVLVSHDLNLVSQYCDRILLLDRGQIVRLGGPDEVIEPEVLESVYRCRVFVDRHPSSGLPRVTLPGRYVPGRQC